MNISSNFLGAALPEGEGAEMLSHLFMPFVAVNYTEALRELRNISGLLCVARPPSRLSKKMFGMAANAR